MFRMVQRVGVVALFECLLQWRALSFWLLIILASAVSVIPVLVLGTGISLPVLEVNVYTTRASVVLLLLPFVFTSVFQRDVRYKMHPLLQVRPLLSFEYMLGKSLAALVLGLLAVLLTLCGSWIVLSAIRLELVSPFAALPFLLVNGAMCLCFTLLFVAVIALIDVPFLGAIFCSGAMIVLNLSSPATPLHMLNLHKNTLFYSSSIGFGPDLSLVLNQGGFFLALALGLFGVVLLLSQMKTRYGMRRWYHLGVALLLCVLGGGLMLPITSAFGQTTKQYLDLGVPPAQPMNAIVSHYQLDVTAHIHSGQLEGKATFQLQSGSEKELLLALNPGLQIQRVTAGQQPISFHTQQGWTRLTLPSGKALTLTLVYAGKLTLGRENYVGPAGGMIDVLGRPNAVYRFLGQGMGVLDGNGAGGWYPLPYVQSLVEAYGSRLPFDRVSVRLPEAEHVWQAAGIFKQETRQIEVTKPGYLPSVFVVAFDTQQQMRLDQTPLVYHGIQPDHKALSTYRLMSRLFNELRNWLEPQNKQPSTAIVLPFLREPVISTHLLLLPEHSLYSSFPIDLEDETVISSFVGEKVAAAWWSDALLQEMVLAKQNATTGQPHGFSFFLEWPTNLKGMLSAYSAINMTGRILGTTYKERVYQLCLERGEYGDKAKMKPEDMAKLSVVSEKIQKLGLSDCPLPTVGLMKLEKKEGEAKITQVLQRFLTAHQQDMRAPTIQQFIKEAGVTLGRDVSADFKPYVPEEMPKP
ncbi:hypothetical protein EI42_05905 [Thermosporothrix hazakensis]|uniref:ABC-type transport system involved in multi-copper enzyme maturation permease subunit n=1 Tax=Thermosporothrix hazakensis TaxID=644383 RepID=A0A326TV52_THEHA|nr:hypothetical protein [Thermosporothrix hazakensis]PZW20532.1 hypothetical protein EI42_05905 [Thermosporothrix hazakensis]GCE51460.1 hypothetical protein KTH_63290 [Thermosporothrix hazakensis]